MGPLLLLLVSLLHAVAAPASRVDGAWRPAGPPGVADVVDVAADGDVVALVTGAGEVWTSTDGGASWRRALAAGEGVGPGFTEAALLDVELRAEELLDDVDVDLVDPETDPVADVADRLRTEALPGGAFAPVTAADRRATWAWRLEVDTVGVTLGRPDGLWSADVETGAWRRLDDAAVEAWLDLGARRVLGGPSGLVVRGDGEEVATSLPAVHDLVRTGDGVLAATDDGIWWSADGRSWRPVGGRLRAWRRVATDGVRVWAASVANVVRVDGDDLLAPTGPSLDDARDVLVEPDGTLLVAARGGAWSSRDGGAGFAPLGHGLAWVAGRALARGGSTLWLATDRGLFALAADTATPDEVPDDGALPPASALRDAALRQLPDVGARGRPAAWLLPQLTLEGRYGASTSTSPVGSLGRGVDGDVQVLARATWRPPAGQGTAAGVPGLVAVADEDGVVQVYSGPFDAWVLLAHAGRRLHDERLRRLDRVDELLAQRAVLVRERAREDRSLREVVDRELRIDEVEAWLDALTDGALVRWRADGRQG